MSSEDQAMLAKISQLAGQINRHKNQQAGVTSTSHYNHYGGYGSGPRRGGGHYQARGYRVAKPAPHRNRSLVLNGAQPTKSDGDSAAASDSSTSSWVTKNDRHLQLINSAVYEKETQARTKAIENTRLQKQLHQDDRERRKLMNHFSHSANHVATNLTPTARYELVVEGVHFYVTKNGSKLVKVPGLSSQRKPVSGDCAYNCEGDLNAPSATPKMAVVGGVKFYRSKNGNLYRHGIIKAHRYVTRTHHGRPLIIDHISQSGAIKKINQPCRIFSTTGTSLLQPQMPISVSRLRIGGKNSAEQTNTLAGSCPQGPRCRYVHDPSKVAACRDFLQKGECADGDLCDLSHELTPERTPNCLHFAKGNCTNPNCRYAHVKVSPGALVCRSFGIYGYCEKGAECADRHVFECPDFSNTGTCKRQGCKLLHRERASVLRKANAARDSNAGNGELVEDISSDEDGESVDSNDVDSDEVDEFFGESGTSDLDFATQKDFISF